jgi:hypothetical protein
MTDTKTTYTVHHATNFRSFDPPVTRIDFTLAYHKVAEVSASCLDEVFQLTNNIDSSWVENEGVTPFGLTPLGVAGSLARGHRSTSVGDIIETQDGRLFVVESLGFRELPDPAVAPAERALFEAGDKIPAITNYRLRTGASLADAKTAFIAAGLWAAGSNWP